MNQEINTIDPQDCSSIQIEIQIRESWIDRLLLEQNMDIPISEKNVLTNLRIGIGNNILIFVADLKEKKNTTFEMSARPEWDAASQSLHIFDLDLKTDTKNVLLKSAGWFAKNFLNAKLDRKLEEQANRMYTKQIEKLKEKPVDIPIPKGGKATVIISSIIIHELKFVDRAIQVRATVDAFWKLNLS